MLIVAIIYEAEGRGSKSRRGKIRKIKPMCHPSRRTCRERNIKAKKGKIFHSLFFDRKTKDKWS